MQCPLLSSLTTVYNILLTTDSKWSYIVRNHSLGAHSSYARGPSMFDTFAPRIHSGIGRLLFASIPRVSKSFPARKTFPMGAAGLFWLIRPIERHPETKIPIKFDASRPRKWTERESKLARMSWSRKTVPEEFFFWPARAAAGRIFSGVGGASQSSPSRLRYFPALFLIYEAPGDSSFGR